jgi:hypothetical protein
MRFGQRGNGTWRRMRSRRPSECEFFQLRDAEEGGYCARALGHPIFTEAGTWDEVRANVLEARSKPHDGILSEVAQLRSMTVEPLTELPRDSAPPPL